MALQLIEMVNIAKTKEARGRGGMELVGVRTKNL